MKKTKTILNIILVLIALSGLTLSVILFGQKADLLVQLNEKQLQVNVVEEENQKLTSDNEALKRDLEANKELQQNFSQIKTDLEDKLKASEDKIISLEADLKDNLWKLEQLKAENAALAKELESLKNQLKPEAQKNPQPGTSSGYAAQTEKEPAKQKKFLFF